MKTYKDKVDELEDYVFELKRLTACQDSRFENYLSEHDKTCIENAHRDLDRITTKLTYMEEYAAYNEENERDEIRAFYQSVLPSTRR